MKIKRIVSGIILATINLSLITGIASAIPYSEDFDALSQPVNALSHAQTSTAENAPAHAEPSALRSLPGGAVWIVDTLADKDDGECILDCTLREAVSLAASGDTIMFAASIAGGTITLEYEPFGPTTEIIIDKNLTIDNSNHLQKTAINGDNYSGIFTINYHKTLTLKNLILENSNSSSGAVSASSGSMLMVENCWFRENGHTNAGGGALKNNQGHVIIQQSLFSNNTGNNGGAIYNYGTLEIYDSTFENNLARSRGGAIYKIGSGLITVERSTFSGNSTLDYDGGAIYNGGSLKFTVINSTFHNNIARNGGAVYGEDLTITMIVNSTFSGNAASNGASGIHVFGDLFLYNSILANSVSGADCYRNAVGPMWGVNNLIENNSTIAPCYHNPPLDSNPLLGPLQDNGGFTQTMALHQTSPAIDAGFSGTDSFGNPYCASTDQRSVSRPQGSACDLGAYEYAVPPIVLSILRADPNPTFAGVVNFEVTFSKPVIGVDLSDFTLTSTGSIFDPAANSISGTGDTYTITVYTGSGIGTIRLNVIDNDSITDGIHPLGGVGTGNGNYTSGEAYTINHPPSFTSTPVTTTLYLEPYTYNIVANDLDVSFYDPLVLSAIEIPDWLTLTDNGDGTGNLEGTPGIGIYGEFDVRLSVTDSMGASATQAFTLLVNRAPSFTSMPNTRATVGSVYTYFITSRDPDGDILSISTSKRPPWLSFTNHGNGTATLTGTPASGDIADINLTVNLSDGYKVVSQAFTISVKSNHPPYFTSTPVTGAVANEPYTYQVNAIDLEGNKITISAPTKPAWLNLATSGGTATLSGMPTNDDVVGDNAVILRAEDAGGNETQSFTIDVAFSNTPPSFTSPAVTDVNVGSLYTYEIAVTDPNPTDHLTITAQTLPGWLSLTDHGNRTATLTGLPRKLDVGDGEVILRVDDPYGGSAEQSFDITINRPPSFTSTPITVAFKNYYYWYDITATDPDGDSLTFSVTSDLDTWDEYYWHSPGGGTAILRAIPGEAQVDLNFPVELTLSDGKATVKQTFSVYVTTNQAPTFTSTPIRLAVVGQPYNYLITAEEPDGQPMTITEYDKPAWASFSDSGDGTATLSGTPTAGNLGSHSVNLLVRDSLLAEGLQQSFSINVVSANHSPTDITMPNRMILEHQPVNTLVGWFQTTDPDFSSGDTFTYSLVSGTGDTDNAAFLIVGNQLRSAEVFDAATQSEYSIRVRTTDLYGAYYEESFEIAVYQINLAPTDIALSNNVIEENSLNGTLVGTLSTTDPNISETFNYELVSGVGDSGNENFSIVNSNELITIATPYTFDYETQSSHTVRIRTTDSGELYFEKAFTIIIEDVNEAPTDILLSKNKVEEGQPEGTLVGILSTVDPDAGDTHTYSLDVGSLDYFYFSIENNELRTAWVFDYETKSSYSIYIITTDSGGLVKYKLFNIMVIREGSGTIFLPLILR